VDVVLRHRFRGPLDSANGGYACGRLAAFVDADVVEVTLRLPPPLELPLEVRPADDSVRLLDGDLLVAEARPAELDLVVPAPVAVAQAEEASARHIPASAPVFAECFSCGVRTEDDGLRIYAGAVVGREPVHAATWEVGETSPEIVWAAIDCSGAYAVGVAGRGDVVLGRMTARVLRAPESGSTGVVIAWPLGEEGRKLYAGTALFADDGELLAYARQTWIDPKPISEG
jgi:hypothetical protein